MQLPVQETIMPTTGVQPFRPIRVLDVEIGGPIPDVPTLDSEEGARYERAVSLVRLHTLPLGVIELSLCNSGLNAVDHASEIWRTLGQQINEHLRRDGLPEVARLGPTGLPSPCIPACLREREAVLADGACATVAVCTRDRPHSLARSLRALVAMRYPRYEILVVDNAPSTNATAELIRTTYGGYNVRYVREDRPGLSWARNRALIEAKGAFIAYTDDDVAVDPYWLAELVSGFNAAENVACTTGIAPPPIELETPAQVWREQFAPFYKRGFARRIFDLTEHRPNNPAYPYAGSIVGTGSNMAFKTSVLRELGGFDTALGAGTIALAGEDFAMFFTVLSRGYRIVYTPSALGYHLHRIDYPALRRQLQGYGVAFTAILTKYLMENPRLVGEFAVKAPYGLYYALSSRSPKNRRKLADYPKELTTIERMGMVYGPIAYLRSRRQAQQIRDEFGPLTLNGPATTGQS